MYVEEAMVDEERLEASLLAEQNVDTQEGKYLTFVLGDEEYGIEIRNVTEIIGIQRITDLPDVPPYVQGVINLRGKVIPVVDVRIRFGLPEREYDERTCIIVININDISVGLIVDSVSEVLDIPDENIEPAPKINTGASSRYIQNLGKVRGNVIILLDLLKLFFDAEVDQMTKASESVWC
jgi:purine-binding chemotaxis protein CheW